jgi:hypothetical protein
VTDRGQAPRAIRFAVEDLPEQLEAFAARWPDARADVRGLAFTGGVGSARLRLPLAAERARPHEPAASYLARAGTGLSRQCVLLLRAGSAAVGYWDGGELVRHRVIRKYVVRGRGKAQPTHLRTRGKSRYGSRLRLQNWKRLLAETNALLRSLWDEFGPPARLFVAVPVRAFAELLAAAPPPPFARDSELLQRVPMHVHEPSFAELARVRAWLLRGRVELGDDA